MLDITTITRIDIASVVGYYADAKTITTAKTAALPRGMVRVLKRWAFPARSVPSASKNCLSGRLTLLHR